LTSDEQTTTQAVDLAEWIVDAISEANQDWRAIELRARELVELATQRTVGDSSRRCPTSYTRWGAADSARARAARTAALSVATS
jgi:hypothetical protein